MTDIQSTIDLINQRIACSSDDARSSAAVVVLINVATLRAAVALLEQMRDGPAMRSPALPSEVEFTCTSCGTRVPASMDTRDLCDKCKREVDGKDRHERGPMLEPRLRQYVRVVTYNEYGIITSQKQASVLQYWHNNEWHDVPLVEGP